MSAAFTKGPWTVGCEGHNACTVYSGDSGIATVFGMGEKWHEGFANANLIAAAPDLYEALDGAPLPSTLGNVESHYQRFYEWYNNVACPALAKARGEQSL